MKKLVFLLAVAFSAALYSCGNKAENAEAADAAADSVAVVATEVVEAAVDTVTGDTIVTAAETVEATPVQ